ncbi:MAG: N-acyl-D-amino-acid deacylase family protein [Candidatus Rokuibacteriota bacterium]
MFDLVVRGGTLVDGSGSPGQPSDVGVTGETIAAVGDLSRAAAARVIDASGLVVAPGFIDTHTHAEGALLVDPQNPMGVRQGITTEFLGIDGMSYAPLSPGNYRTFRRWLGGLLGDPPDDLDMRTVAAFRSHYHRKVAVNTAYLVPHGTVRLEVLGFRDAPLTGDALAAAGRLVREGLEQGAVGFSTGSKYYPGPWADTRELIELGRVVREAGAVYMCEPRSANLERAHGGHGVAEALEVARQTGVRLHFAHYRTTPATAGRVDRIMERIDPARSEGVDATFDVYPYPAGSSIAVSLLPSEAQEGGPEAILARLADPAERGRLAAWLDRSSTLPLAELVFSYVPRRPDLEGMSLADAARREGGSMGEVLCRILLDEELKVGYLGAPPPSPAVWRQLSRDCMALLGRPDYMVCSDMTPAGGFPHPRSYGAFPRFLGRLRREFGGLTLEAMVERMTDRPARRFGIPRRGRVARGWFADLVVFDPARVIDNATYDDPRQYPTGIPFVVVNGQVAVDKERCTGVLAGHAVP